MLKWGPHTKWILAFLGSIAGTGVLLAVVSHGYHIGAIDPNAWLYWKSNAITGFTYNPGYLFLTIQTILLGVITVYAVKIHRLWKKGWDIKLWDDRK